MSEETNIAWCDATWNWVRGCEKVSPGCKNCYAEKYVNRFGDFSQRTVAADATFDAPLKWNKKPLIGNYCGKSFSANEPGSEGGRCCPFCSTETDHEPCHRRRVFSLSLGDWLDPKIPVPVLARALDIIRRCPDLDFLLCTKRPELFWDRTGLACDLHNGAPMVSHETYEWIMDWRLRNKPPHNVWVIASAEDQQRLDERVPHLLKIPAVVHGLSCEPLLGPIDLMDTGAIDHSPDPDDHSYGLSGNIDWVIVGGESGKNARPCNVEWVRSIKDQCKAAGVACFVKQLGASCGQVWSGGTGGIGVPLPIKHPKGGDPSEWPEYLRVREFPSGASR